MIFLHKRPSCKAPSGSTPCQLNTSCCPTASWSSTQPLPANGLPNVRGVCINMAGMLQVQTADRTKRQRLKCMSQCVSISLLAYVPP
ncbi:hypothetical protein PBY51_013692 [Eleginops maclovinus]|nr:hypothetical protein PBY51_013692 [Eleginops maclovinus]